MSEENQNEEETFETEEGADLESTTVDHTEEQEQDNLETDQNASEDDSSHEEEVEQYSKSVQKRIAKLTGRMREAERREQAALQYAQGLQHEIHQNKSLQSQVQNKDEALFGQYSKNVESNLAIAKENYKRAHESGDVDALVEAQQEISRFSVEQENLKRVAVKRKRAADVQSANQLQQQQQQQQQMQFQQAQQQPQVDEKAEEWAENNEWFGNDQAMTYAAFGIHRKLLEEGVDPKSDLYYNRLDKELKGTFPTKLGNANTESLTTKQTVASANRSSSKGRSTKVKLTQSEIAIANKLGVPLEQYAKYKTA